MNLTYLTCAVVLICLSDIGSAARQRTPRNRRSGASNNDLKRFSEKLFAMRKPVFGNVNLQIQSKGSSCNKDNARKDLFQTKMDQIYGSETAQALLPLLDNYDPDVRKPEKDNSQERFEMQLFMDAVMNTPEMKETYNFLKQKGVFTGSWESFEPHIRKIWTGLFDNDGTRNNVLGSSGFEHVFIGEVKKGKVSGQHNWIQMFMEEKDGHINYKGYLKQVNFAPDVVGLKMNYEWNGERKCGGSTLVGTTPELEMALATVCFKTRPNANCYLSLGKKNLSYKTYTFTYRGYDYLATAYPQI